MENIREQKVQSNKSRTVWRSVLLVAFILSAIASVVFFAVYKYRQSDDIAKYTEKGCASYEVVLKEDYNPYGDGVASSNMQYLSSKLEGVNANLYYKLHIKDMKVGDVEYKYTYTLKEVAQVVSKETGKTIISYEHEIKTKTVNSVKAEELKIGETHYLDYAYHDAKVTQFINQQSDLRSHAVTCTLKLVLEINLKGVCQDFEDDFSKHPTVYISVPLTTDTVSISNGSNITKGEGKVVLCKNLSNDKPYLHTAYICAGATVALLVLWYVYGKLTMSQDDKFVKTAGKIQSNYGSYIQHINQPISQNYEQVVEFTKFVDLLEVSNIIKQPVFVEKQTDDETVYVVPESTNRIYMFRLNRESFAKKEKPAKAQKSVKTKKKIEIEDDWAEDSSADEKVGAKMNADRPAQSRVAVPVRPENVANQEAEKADEPKKEKVNEQKPVRIKKVKDKYDLDNIKEEHLSMKLQPLSAEDIARAEKMVTSAKINRTMSNYEKQKADKKKIYDIIETDLHKLTTDQNSATITANKVPESKPIDKVVAPKPVQSKAITTKTDTNKAVVKKSATVDAKKTVAKSASKSSTAKAKSNSKSPTAVNLSFDGVDTGKVINVSIQTTDTDD